VILARIPTGTLIVFMRELREHTVGVKSAQIMKIYTRSAFYGLICTFVDAVGCRNQTISKNIHRFSGNTVYIL
jgi:hypothetical protein